MRILFPFIGAAPAAAPAAFPAPGPAPVPALPNQAARVQEGARFLLDHVLVNVSGESKEKVQDCDVEIYMPVLLKAVYIYAAGLEKVKQIPLFFKDATRTLIENFRQKWADAVPSQGIQDAIQRLRDFKDDDFLKDDSVKFLQDLRQIASEELQGSLLATSCWQQVLNSPDFT